MTSDKEFKWRSERGYTEAIRLYVDYVGVWDTVSALDVSKWLLGPIYFNQKYEFHDAKLSSSVLSARPAISLDERRSTFPAQS